MIDGPTIKTAVAVAIVRGPGWRAAFDIRSAAGNAANVQSDRGRENRGDTFFDWLHGWFLKG